MTAIEALTVALPLMSKYDPRQCQLSMALASLSNGECWIVRVYHNGEQLYCVAVDNNGGRIIGVRGPK